MNIRSIKNGLFILFTLNGLFFCRKSVVIIILAAIAFFGVSCANRKKINKLSYFQELNDTSLKLVNGDFEPLIQRGDILYVAVNSLDPVSSTLFNSVNSFTTISAATGTTSLSGGATVTPGLVVDAEGNIKLPKVGTIKAIGKTKTNLTKEIQEDLLPYLKDPIVTLRFMNYRVTVLGEVSRPGTLIISNERVSILEALGLCGDLTIYGKRTNILLIRENNGIKETHRINLNDNSLFSRPYFYLQSNDVLYVQPNKSREYSSTTAPQTIPIFLSSLSLLIIILDRVIK
jgi:polysaccharide export outer membrane protein